MFRFFDLSYSERDGTTPRGRTLITRLEGRQECLVVKEEGTSSPTSKENIDTAVVGTELGGITPHKQLVALEDKVLTKFSLTDLTSVLTVIDQNLDGSRPTTWNPPEVG